MRRALALGVVALAVWLSLTPRPPAVAGLPSGSDLLVHLLMHAGVAWALLRAWPGAGPAALALAVALEAGQLAVPGRHFFFGDMAANMAGVALGALAQPILVAASRASSSATPRPGASPSANQPSRAASGAASGKSRRSGDHSGGS